MYCNNCGKEINDNSRYCNFCGQAITLKSEVLNNKQAINNTTDVIKCPVCHEHEPVAKVSAVYKRYISEINTSGGAVSFGLSKSPSVYITPIWMHGINIYEIGRLLSPPPTPVQKSSKGLFTFLVLLLIFLAPFGAFGLYISITDGGAWWFFPGGIFILYFIIIFSMVRRNNKNTSVYKSELNRYKISKPKWDMLYYCGKDDIVFKPETGDFTSSDNAYQFYL